MTQENQTYPPFDLTRLLKSVFIPIEGCKVCILMDLDAPETLVDEPFLRDESLPVQRKAYEVFYLGLKNGTMEALGLSGGEIFAYKTTGGSNLDLPDAAWNQHGEQISLEKDVYPVYDLILCISTYSATAPLTAFAKKYGFRGSTMHGVNEVILKSGLSVDYNVVSAEAEKLRLGMTRADAVEIDTVVAGVPYTLRLELGKQEAQKSHGLCHTEKPDIANLPAGEVYFVPTSAQGFFPLKHEDADGTITLNEVKDGRIVDITLLQGNPQIAVDHKARIASEPLCGEIGELGFGTQRLPYAKADIQDEKVLGTVHVATGRSDHLGGHLTPDKFMDAGKATHDDLLFHPDKTPEIQLTQVRMEKDGTTLVLIENYAPAAAMLDLLNDQG